jgi:hypothetical protein
MGPFFHKINPSGLCYQKPKLITIVHMFNLLAKAYTKHGDKLMKILIEAPESSTEEDAAWQFFDFFEFFLPLVCTCLASINHKGWF